MQTAPSFELRTAVAQALAPLTDRLDAAAFVLLALLICFIGAASFLRARRFSGARELGFGFSAILIYGWNTEAGRELLQQAHSALFLFEHQDGSVSFDLLRLCFSDDRPTLLYLDTTRTHSKV